MKKYLLALFVLLIPSMAQGAAGQPVPYEVEGEAYEGYFVSPRDEAPLVLLVHDWDGLTDYEVKRAEMLAELGYAVFAVDLFGAGVRPESTEEKKALTGALYADRDAMRARLNGALEAAAAQGADVANAVAIGYCFGGAAVLEFARSGVELKGFVTFHGGLQTPEGQDYAATRGFVLVFHGTSDSAVSMADFASLAVQLEEAGVPHEMTTYSGAPHAFTVFGSDRYHETADTQSWTRFTRFLDETLSH